ncbi:heavy metal-associated domain-containing protein [Treponema sp. HNW]|uniref:heavy-metal-associated domain-containing protein n=1 Tax=Treponema sp. HNW TaxID=3116654 RepID=UPI003D0DD931
MDQKIYVAGMLGPDDEKKIFEAVSVIRGVSNCTVSFEKAQVAFSLDESAADLDKIKTAISSCGFDVLG